MSKEILFLIATLITTIIVIFTIGFVFFTAAPIFQKEGLNFIIGSVYNYDTHQYGILPFISATVFVTILALMIACPIGIFSAIFMAEFAPKQLTNIIRPLIELLVGIPSVVYGIFGMFVFREFIYNYINPLFVIISDTFGISFFADYTKGGFGYLLGAFVLAIMILPTITVLTLEALKAIPQCYKEASYSLGATQWETIKKVCLKFAVSGIIFAIIFGMMRALGETMAIVMLLGNSPHMPQSILDSGYALTSKILEDSKYYVIIPEGRSAIFGMAAVLFMIEMALLLVARKVGAMLK